MASATAVTACGAAAGVALAEEKDPTDDLEVVAADKTLLAEIPAGANVQLHTVSLSQQAETQATAADRAAHKAAQRSARMRAAEQARERKEKAEEAARKAREAAEARRARSELSLDVKLSYTIAEIQAMARAMIPGDDFICFSNIVDHESDWNYQAVNPSSGAYGLMQALPGYKMASAGADWRTNPATQIKWGLTYMNDRYGSPCGAWEFWQANNWY